ncbi:MAG: amidohydrolase family protein [Bacteroidia bacterium]|nr:amidohydrolase family protein [Bacteroidia bacterium]MDW8015474.1 amidohydrolase family protein [Bacteroidia bacterium]
MWRLITIWSLLWAQSQSLLPLRGPQRGKPTQVAIVGATLWLAPGKYIKDGVLLIQNGRIARIGQRGSISIPSTAAILSYPSNVWVYPAFVEIWSHWGLRTQSPPPSPQPQYDPIRHPLYYPADAVRLDYAAETAFVYEAEHAKKLREMGFAVAHVAPREGILRGTGATLLLCEELQPAQRFLSGASILHAGFEKGSSTQMYPTSKMGGIALVRQLLYDWLWYRQFASPPVTNVSLERLRILWKDTLRWTWVAQTPEDVFRVARISSEWKQGGPLRWAVLGTGYEYEWLKFLPKDGVYIMPVGLPTLPPAHTAEKYAQLPLLALRRWETAPFRARWLLQRGYTLALTATGLTEPATFWEHLRLIARTTSAPDSLLLSLTTIPAEWLKLSDIGRLAPHYRANLLIFSDTLWNEEAKLLEIWIDGHQEVLISLPPAQPQGTYLLWPMGWQWRFPARSGFPLPTRLILGEKDTQLVEVEYDPLRALFSARVKSSAAAGDWTFEVQNETLLVGTHLHPTGERYQWMAKRIALSTDTPSQRISPSLLEDSLYSRLTHPPGFYGRAVYPAPLPILFRRATLWTGDTILPETDLYIADGKIRRIGKNLPIPPNTQVIEANGAALTAGIIDEHSHIAIEGGVNEYSDAVTSEVRIADVIDPTDINIYRHLAGGVTTVQLLHGSANPIGGQSACIKLRWGLPADSFLIPDAPPFNKFALGENVKQSNWGEAFTIRYPQTRMGVEQIIVDAFLAARRYMQEHENFKRRQSRSEGKTLPRRDLRLEALAEILTGKRFITCHSYVQSEIIMLMRVAEQLGFRVRIFTHALEGYKVAPELKAHGAFASTFSDWWAYKYEVINAIPHNSAILLKYRVPTCINSDDAEMGRRLNQEAAKVLRYGEGIDSLEAWRTVTVYPAQALGISHRVGFIKEGYDADLVLWDRPTPLSVYSRVRMTFVDGRKLYDAEENEKLYQERLQEKNRLVMKAWRSLQSEKKGVPLLVRRAVLWHCESRDE